MVTSGNIIRPEPLEAFWVQHTIFSINILSIDFNALKLIVDGKNGFPQFDIQGFSIRLSRLYYEWMTDWCLCDAQARGDGHHQDQAKVVRNHPRRSGQVQLPGQEVCGSPGRGQAECVGAQHPGLHWGQLLRGCCLRGDSKELQWLQQLEMLPWAHEAGWTLEIWQRQPKAVFAQLWKVSPSSKNIVNRK